MSTPQKNNPSFEFITPDDTREESDTVPQPFSPSVPIQRRAKAPSVMSTFEGEVYFDHVHCKFCVWNPRHFFRSFGGKQGF